ncbi:hypothetical protein D3C81_1843070 [compost metagenome]
MLVHAIGVVVVAPGHLVAGFGPAAAENPATGRRAAVVLELAEPGQLRIALDQRPRGVGKVGDGVAVDLLGQFFR